MSGASAPPVSIPAPVSGRLTITSPDEEGNAHVIGEEAVAADSLVHVFNATQGESSLKLLELPDVCSQAFHSCAIADDSGSFEIEIPASEGDEIVVTILDPDTGETISEELRSEIPDNIQIFPRAILALGLLHTEGEETLYTLMGSDEEDSLGLVSIADLVEETEIQVSFVGSSPSQILINSASHEAAVLDDLGEFIAKVDLETNNFDDPTLVSVGAPQKMVMNQAGDTLFIATGGENASLVKIDFTTMTITDTVTDDRLQNAALEVGNIETAGMDIIRFSGHSDIDLLAFTGTYLVNGEPRAAVGLVDGTDMSLLAIALLPEGAVPEDVAFFVVHNRLLVTDSGNDEILVYSFATNESSGFPQSLTLEGAIDDPDAQIVDPSRIEVYSGGYAFVTAFNGNDEQSDSILTIELGHSSDSSSDLLNVTPVGYSPSDALFDASDEILYISTFETQVTFELELSDLLSGSTD